MDLQNPFLVGAFNPFEKYLSNWKPSPTRGEHRNCLKPPPRYFFCRESMVTSYNLQEVVTTCDLLQLLSFWLCGLPGVGNNSSCCYTLPFLGANIYPLFKIIFLFPLCDLSLEVKILQFHDSFSFFFRNQKLLIA